ncbi:MAG TPA: Hsp33 family molecular chaperone HslO [Polyangia bacterium]|nr:Hsp33 family molecular chaperone HslO [Polyangia bacterium]
MADHITRALLDPPRVRVVSTLTTDTVAEAAQRHGLSGVAAVALGRALTSGLLLATLTKGDERVTLHIAGDGPISLITVDANDAGEVRGYLSPRGAVAPLLARPRPQVGPAVGRHGQVSVLRDLGLREQYRGSAALVTGEIDEDVEAYLRVSEQIDSALGCEVVLQSPRVACAGGVLIQALPGGEPALIREIQHRLRRQELYEALAGPAPPADAVALARLLLPDAALKVIDQRPVCFRCRCSATRARSLLGLLEPAELDDMLARDGGAEVTCNFCCQRYPIDGAALKEIRDAAARRPPRERN